MALKLIGSTGRNKKPKIYYKYFGEAIDDVYRYVSDKYVIDDTDFFQQLSSGGKPKLHQTKRAVIRLYSKTTGKELKKGLAVQVYRLSDDTFELNWYIS